MENYVNYPSEVGVLQRSMITQNFTQEKVITEMDFADLEAHFWASGGEFFSKVMENFKCYVFISAKRGHKEPHDLNEVLENMAFFSGYQMHKTVGCSKRIYHLYVKYDDESVATAARDYFRLKGKRAELVHHMLNLWYAFEKVQGQRKCLTTGWLTLPDGTYPNSEVVKNMLGKYGNAYVEAVVDKSVKVSFNSVADAFATSIALGPWYFQENLVESKYYSLQIELTDYCARVMRMCNTTCVSRDVSSEFEYFVQNVTIDHSNDSNQRSNPRVNRNRFVKRSNRTGWRTQNVRRTSSKNKVQSEHSTSFNSAVTA